jgi:hypothetical protein
VADDRATSQLRKLGLNPGARWSVDGAAPGWSFEVAPDPSYEVVVGSPADVVLAFVTAADQIAPTLARLERSVFPAGALWIAWPRRAAGHVSDVTDSAVRDAALDRSLVDTKIAAIDANWSGLKLVWRVSARS